MELLKQYLFEWSVSNSIAIVILLVALWRTKFARLLFVLVFGGACWVNYSMAHNTPEAYLEYANLTPFSLYRDFINGWFKEHITLMVTAISIGQGLIALGMLLKGWWVRWACYGAIVFLTAIIPLGIGSGFPFSIIVIIALYYILKNDDLNYLWKLGRKEAAVAI